MSKNKYQLLQNTFGFDEFRPLQEAVVDKILNREDVLLMFASSFGIKVACIFSLRVIISSISRGNSSLKILILMHFPSL
jgi:hypothetical protein